MSNSFSQTNNTGNNVNPHQSAIQAEQERLQKALARRMAEHSATGATNRLAGRSLDSVRANTWFPSLTRGGSAAGGYVILPTALAEKADLAKMPRWRVELHGLNGSAQPIGFDLIGDVVLGRGKDGPTVPDVDLDQFGAQKQGVSRRHVILRPTEKHLYLIDLNSTNGTMHNGLPVGPGVARSMQHNDSIMLGDLTFTLKIVAKPGVPTPTTNDRASYSDIIQQEAVRREMAKSTAPENMTTQMPLAAALKMSGAAQSKVNDTTPRPIPAATPAVQAALPAVASAAPVAEAKLETAATPAKPAKIMGLRARLTGKK